MNLNAFNNYSSQYLPHNVVLSYINFISALVNNPQQYENKESYFLEKAPVSML